MPTKKTPAKRPSASRAKPVTIQVKDQTIEQKQAKVQAYATLKNAGLPIPSELALEVGALVAAQQKHEEENRRAQAAAQTEEDKQIAVADKKGPKWVRNCRIASFAFRLERQDEGKKRVELKPRGNRGDMFPLLDEDLNDPNLQTHVETGFLEVIGDGTAKSILAKQTRNLQRSHTPLATIRNEKGEEYAPGSVKVTAEFNQQGVVVATTNPNINPEEDKAVAKGGPLGNLLRPEQVAQFVPTGGNSAIISSGFDQNTQAKISDDIARRKNIDGPKAAGIISVTVDPVQKD